MGIVEQYLLQLNTEKQRLRRFTAVMTALSILVVSAVSWSLRLTGITLANDASCGFVEHQHTDECPVERVLICGYPEVTDETQPPAEPMPTEAPKAEEPAPTEAPKAEEPAPTEAPKAEEPTPTEAPKAEEPTPTEAPKVGEPAPTEAPKAEEPTPTEAPKVEEPELEQTAAAPSSASPKPGAEVIILEEPAILAADVLLPNAETKHVHTDECYRITYLCGYDEEHIHDLSCYSDSSADLESAQVWTSTLPRLTNKWANDIARVAQSQLGCAESERNYVVEDGTQTKNGITRYGQWYGNPHGDWSSLFVMFCLNYADIPQSVIPWSSGVQNMMRLAQDADIFQKPDTAIDTVGNILFMDTDGNGKADRSLIVTASAGGTLTAVGGDLENAVREVTLSKINSSLLGYINVAEAQTAYLAAQTPQETTPEETTPEETTPEETTPEETTPEETIPEETTPEETTPEETTPEETVPEETTPEETIPEETTEAAGDDQQQSDEPEIALDVEFLEEEQLMRLVAQTANIDDELFSWQWQVSEDGNDPWVDIEGAEGFLYELAATEENALRYYRLQGHRIEQVQMTFALTRAITVTDVESGTITSGAISPFSIGKNRNVYTIDVYAIPVDASGQRVADIALTSLGSFQVNSTTRITAESRFNTSLGVYRSAYFGTETSVSVDDVASVWRQNRYGTYYLAYAQTNGTEVTTWKNSADTRMSLYLRYTPPFTVTFESEGFDAVTEKVFYGAVPTLTEPGTWTREGHTLAGWIIGSDEQTVYTYEELLNRPVYENVTYRAKWWKDITVTYDLGAYTEALYPVLPDVVYYGGSIDQYPTPAWRNNAVAMAFDGWYLDESFQEPVVPDYVFYQDTTLYAKWTAVDDGYYVYFMDFARDEETPLVLVTYNVTEGRTTAPYAPGNAPEGTQWDGKWYLDRECTQVYDFRLPVSQMTDHLTGVNGRDLYLYPGVQAVCRAIFITYGTKIDPVTVPVGETIDLDQYTPERPGYVFAGWALKDGTPVSGVQALDETTTYYATWKAGHVSFEAILRIENANDSGMTQAEILGTWYALAGSQIRVNSTYTGSGTNRTGTHRVVCVLDGVEYPVYTNAEMTRQATLSDTYATYFIYNNSGTEWTDEVNWDDVYTGGELPYSTRPISSAGDTIINFDYMRVRRDIVFTIPNSSAYMDVYDLYQNGLITGSVTYTGTKPTAAGSNVSATGVSATNVSWSYTATTNSTGNNLYTLHDMKYGQRIYEVYPVGSSWLTTRSTDFHQYRTGNNQLFSSRREDLSAAFFSGSGRKLTPYSMTAEFKNQERIALMYAIECLSGETADFTIDGKGYKVQTQLCEVVRHTGDFGIKELLGCKPGINPREGLDPEYYSGLDNSTATLGGTSVKTLFGTTYWDYYKTYVTSLSQINRAYIFYYDRMYMSIQFNFAYDSNGDGSNETMEYENIAYGEAITEYQFGMPDFAQHELLEREGYEFAGWLDANGYVLETEDWASMVATGDSETSSMIFVAKWEKVSNNIVEYYEDVSADTPFESHYFDDGALLEYPTMSVYPQGWVWQEYGEGAYERFDWDVPMYGEYGVQEVRQINGEDTVVNVLRIYGTWDESHTRVVYDPNASHGGIPGSAPVDSNEYTIWQSEVPVMSQGGTANVDPDAVFVGWQLDRNGIVYQAGDHVAVHWPRTMIFTAQWAKTDEIVHLRYDPNGGWPQERYPSESGYAYKMGATASVWDNTGMDGSSWFHWTGYTFIGWNTQPDGSGTAVHPGSDIVLTEPVTTLYAQWRRDTHDFTLHKVDRLNGRPLAGAVFDLYKYENGDFLRLESQTTGTDGRIVFSDIETGTVYKLVEARPPGGYATITKEVCFRLSPGSGTVSLEFCDLEGNWGIAPNGISGEYISGSHHLLLEVENVAGFKLPATGGIGTPLYILCGAILMLAPFVYGFRLRRRQERRAAK